MTEFVYPVPRLWRGVACVLSGGFDDGDTCLEDAASVAEESGAHEAFAMALCERALVAVARSNWDQAAVLADRASGALREAGIEDSYVPSLICAVHGRVDLALADLAGARTLMRGVDDVLRRRPRLGNLAGEAQVLRTWLAEERRSNTPGASSLTAAEIRLLPMLSTHLSFPEIAESMDHYFESGDDGMGQSGPVSG